MKPLVTGAPDSATGASLSLVSWTVATLLAIAGCGPEPSPAPGWQAASVIPSNDMGICLSSVGAAAAPNGDLFVVWLAHEDFSLLPSEVWAAVRRSDGAWTPPVRLDVDETGPLVHFGGDVHLAVDHEG